jgi:hypothetical protein
VTNLGTFVYADPGQDICARGGGLLERYAPRPAPTATPARPPSSAVDEAVHGKKRDAVRELLGKPKEIGGSRWTYESAAGDLRIYF